MSTMRTLGLAAAALICLSLVPHAAAANGPALRDSETAVKTAAPTAGCEAASVARRPGVVADAGTEAMSRQALQADAAGGAFDPAPALRPRCGPNTDEICCYDTPTQSCCCAPFAGCYCVPITW